MVEGNGFTEPLLPIMLVVLYHLKKRDYVLINQIQNNCQTMMKEIKPQKYEIFGVGRRLIFSGYMAVQ